MCVGERKVCRSSPDLNNLTAVELPPWRETSSSDRQGKRDLRRGRRGCASEARGSRFALGLGLGLGGAFEGNAGQRGGAITKFRAGMDCNFVLDDGVKTLSSRKAAVSARKSQRRDGGRFGKARRGGIGVQIRSHLYSMPLHRLRSGTKA